MSLKLAKASVEDGIIVYQKKFFRRAGRSFINSKIILVTIWYTAEPRKLEDSHIRRPQKFEEAFSYYCWIRVILLKFSSNSESFYWKKFLHSFLKTDLLFWQFDGSYFHLKCLYVWILNNKKWCFLKKHEKSQEMRISIEWIWQHLFR